MLSCRRLSRKLVRSSTMYRRPHRLLLLGPVPLAAAAAVVGSSFCCAMRLRRESSKRGEEQEEEEEEGHARGVYP